MPPTCAFAISKYSSPPSRWQDKGKPAATLGRKATGPFGVAELPNAIEPSHASPRGTTSELPQLGLRTCGLERLLLPPRASLRPSSGGARLRPSLLCRVGSWRTPLHTKHGTKHTNPDLTEAACRHHGAHLRIRVRRSSLPAFAPEQVGQRRMAHTAVVHTLSSFGKESKRVGWCWEHHEPPRFRRSPPSLWGRTLLASGGDA